MSKHFNDPERAADILQEFVLPERLERMNQVLAQRSSSLTIVLDRIHHEHNISAVLRSADAFGVSSVQIIGGSFRPSSGVALGAERWLEIRRFENAAESIAALKQDRFEIVTLQPFEKSFGCLQPVPIFNLPFDRKLALVFGNEVDGVDAQFLEHAQHGAYIPMFGFVESLNISVAAAICLFCSTLPSETAATRRFQGLSQEKQQELRGRWLQRDVRGAELILKRSSAD